MLGRGGIDPVGRQPYLLMAASGPAPGEERVKHCDGRFLSVRDCLEFLLSLPAGPILVGFYFGYDATQILRGISKIDTVKRILDPAQGKSGPLPTYWRLCHHLPARTVFQGLPGRSQRIETED
jgi:hypothetical protein